MSKPANKDEIIRSCLPFSRRMQTAHFFDVKIQWNPCESIHNLCVYRKFDILHSLSEEKRKKFLDNFSVIAAARVFLEGFTLRLEFSALAHE